MTNEHVGLVEQFAEPMGVQEMGCGQAGATEAVPDCTKKLSVLLRVLSSQPFTSQ